MNHSIKRGLFKYYAGISIAGFIVAILLRIYEKVDWQTFLGIAAGFLSFAYGVQRQQLDELLLFKKLFDQFNKRYDKMNENLNRIHLDQHPTEQPFTVDERDVLFNYFNLCGEEYLYYMKGFIYPEVWTAWKNGMTYYRRNTRIRDFWDDDLKTGSYYGLKFDGGKHER